MAVTQRTLERAFEVGSSLMVSGTIDREWLLEIHAHVEAFQTTPDGRWCAEHFGLLHFVSVYLPSRYLAAHKSFGQNLDTERELTHLMMTTEHALWNSLARVPLASLCAHERELPELVFGLGGEVAIDTHGREAWGMLYQTALDSTLARWKHDRMWTAWEAMAMHFVSMYQDLMVTGRTQFLPSRSPMSSAYIPNLPHEFDARTQACVHNRMSAMQQGDFYATWNSLPRTFGLCGRRDVTEVRLMCTLMYSQHQPTSP